jgi:hypothetical protein
VAAPAAGAEPDPAAVVEAELAEAATLEPAAGAGLEPADRAAVAAQLGRSPRGARAVAHRCPCGRPDVVETSPRLADGTPFPTLYYLTCPRAVTAVSTLESAGTMRAMSARLDTDPELAAQYRRAHELYLARRAEIGEVAEIDGISAGGMPNRVKCLHVQLAQSLAQGPGVNPFGDETRDTIGPWWTDGPCVS